MQPFLQDIVMKTRWTWNHIASEGQALRQMMWFLTWPLGYVDKILGQAECEQPNEGYE